MSESDRTRILALEHEGLYILTYLALKLHDERHGTSYSLDPGFLKRMGTWEIDNIPWNVTSEKHRVELLNLLFGNVLTI